MTRNIFRRLTLVKLHARCRGGALGRATATVVYRQGQHEGLEECTQARRHQAFPLARLAACVGHVARHGRYNDGGTAGARCVEVRRDGEALRALRAGAIASGGQTNWLLVPPMAEHPMPGSRLLHGIETSWLTRASFRFRTKIVMPHILQPINN